jgi:hypothetical protein
MRRRRQALAAALAAALALSFAAAGCGEDEPPAPAPAGDRFDADRAMADVRAQVALGPRPAGSAANAEQARMLGRELEDAGVRGVRIQRPWANVVGTIPGSEPGYVLIAAHHDTKDIPGFVGANDGASGVAVVLGLARALGGGVEGPSIAIALFDAEEARGERSFTSDGTRGSRQYVAYGERGGVQGSVPPGRLDAMYLFDMVGDCELGIPREEASDPRLYAKLADAADGAPFEGRTSVVLDDHVPFLQAGVPAVDAIDFDYGPGPTPGEWWHTGEDTTDKVCPESLDAVGEAAIGAIGAG